MPLTMTILSIDGESPSDTSEIKDTTKQSLGAVDDVKLTIEAVHSSTTYRKDKTPYGDVLVARTLGADHTHFDYYLYISNDHVDFIALELFNVGNFFPELRALCETCDWTVYDPVGKLLPLNQNGLANFEESDRPESSLVTRDDLRSILRQWHDKTVTTQKLLCWVKARLIPDLAVTDEEPDTGESVSREVLDLLFNLDFHKTYPEDVPAFLRFLDSPIGQFDLAREKLIEEKYRILSESQREARAEGLWPYDSFATPPQSG